MNPLAFAPSGEEGAIMKRLLFTGLAGLLALAHPVGVEALARPELSMLVAGLRVPVGAMWLIGPMVLAVAGAVTIGWRRASTDGRSNAHDRR